MWRFPYTSGYTIGQTPGTPGPTLAAMKTILALVATALLLAGPAQAQPQPRIYSQAELDSLLAPVALHPDGLLSQILIAATYPDEVAAAAAWSRANPHLRGDDAVRAVQYEPWDPAVKALVAFPDLLARMDESPQWLHELGDAFLLQQAQVMDTVQGLRRRAQASGNLTGTHHDVVQQGEAIVIQPRAQVVYVNYYDPYVVYGPWWWPHYHPVFWRPWVARPVFFARGFFYCAPDWHHRHVRVVHRPVHVHHHHHAHVVPGKWQHARHVSAAPSARPHVRVPESRRQPVIRSAPAATPSSKPEQRQPIVQQHMPAAHGFSPQRPQAEQQRPQAVQQRPQAVPERKEVRREQRIEPRHEQRIEARREPRIEPRREQRVEPRHEQRRESGQGRGHRG